MVRLPAFARFGHAMDELENVEESGVYLAATMRASEVATSTSKVKELINRGIDTLTTHGMAQPAVDAPPGQYELHTAGPCDALLSWLVDEQQNVAHMVCEAIHDQLDELPDNYRLESVHIDGVKGHVGLRFRCSWSDHGLGVLLQNGAVKKMGRSSLAVVA